MLLLLGCSGTDGAGVTFVQVSDTTRREFAIRLITPRSRAYDYPNI